MVDETAYGLRVHPRVDAPTAIERVTAALAAEGFGILTTIDMQHALEQKIGRRIRPYTILGACNPTLASRALDAEPEVGLLLPCNVLVYERADGVTVVAAMAPLSALGVVGDNEALRAVAREADERLRRALETVAA